MPHIRNVGGVSYCHFLYMPAVLNIVTTGNGTGTKNVLTTWTRSTVSYLLYVNIEIDPFSCEQKSSI